MRRIVSLFILTLLMAISTAAAAASPVRDGSDAGRLVRLPNGQSV